MRTSNKAKTPSAPTPEVSIINPTARGIKSMKNDITLVNKSQIEVLIKINQSNINNESIQTVNARELHCYLESKQDFSTWIKKRIKDYGFIENIDFVRFHKKMEANNATIIDYFITIDMAKELSMVERNQKGKKARQYFIQCEKQSKQDPIKALNDPLIMRGLLLTYSEKVLLLEEKLEEMKPTVAAFDRIATKAEGSMCITDTAKHLQVQPRKFFQELNLMGWIYKRTGGHHWLGYQDKVKQGLLEHKITTVSRSDGSEKIVEQVLVTPKGLAKLSQILSQEIAA
jgi:anti-repressor protein